MKKNSIEESLEDIIPEFSELTASKVEVIASIVLTFGYSLSTLATILAAKEEEEKNEKAEQLKTSQSIDSSKQFKQMYKQLQLVNNRLESIERKLNRM